MPEHEINLIKIQLAKLEAEWKSHGDSSIEFRKDVKISMHEITESIKKLSESFNCYQLGGLDRKTDCFDLSKRYTDKAVAWALAVPATVLVLIKLIDVFHQ